MLLATGRKPNTQTLGLDKVPPPPSPRSIHTPTPTPALDSLGSAHTARMVLKPTTHDWGIGEQRMCDCSRLGDCLGGCLCTPPRWDTTLGQVLPQRLEEPPLLVCSTAKTATSASAPNQGGNITCGCRQTPHAAR